MFSFRQLMMLMVVFILSISTVQAVIQSIELNSDETAIEVSSVNRSGLIIEYRFDNLYHFTVTTERGDFTEIYLNGSAHTNIIGEPKLPMSRRFISVPLEAEVVFNVVDYTVSEYRLSEHGIVYPIIPGQHPVPKCPDTDPPPFEYSAKAYASNVFTGYPLVRGEDLDILRGVRFFAVELHPVEYNPREGIIRVYNNIRIEVSYSGANFALTDELRQKTFSPYFEPIYREQLLNYEPVAERQNLTRYPVKYIIISDPMFSDALQPFIEWKIMKGFETIVGYVGSPEVGSSTTSIKNYIQAIWDASTPEDPAPSFVLFVGDTAQIPPFSGQTGSHITDLHYVRLEGAGYFPDMFYGRFSANNLTELQPQIDKTLEYEKLLMPDPSYLGEAVLIAGHDTYWAQSHGNGHINYGTEHYFNAANGIYSHTYLYPASSGSAQAIINNVSDGVGYVNYTAHGSPTTWSNPSFTINNIYSLQNAGKYPFVVGNCCITNQFNIYECFGEAWLRAPNKGAIGYIGGTDNTYWNEDYWWGVGHIPSIPSHGNALPYNQTGPGMFDGLFHTHGEDFINWYTTGGAMIYAGNMAVEQSNSSRKFYYWEIYALMGDPSLTPYMRVPLENVANYPAQIFLGQSQIQISAEPYSYVGLTMNNEIHGVALIDESGTVTMDITPFTTPGEATLVITLQNHEPLITEIQIIPNEGPYVIMNDYQIDVVGSTDNIPQFGDTVKFHVVFENVGVEEATDVVAELSTEDQFVTIVDDYQFIGDIEPEGSIIMVNAFEIILAENIPDQHRIFFTIDIADDNDDLWSSSFNFVVAAPSFYVEYPDIHDPEPEGNDNGLLEPGETATLSFPVSNLGHAQSPETTVRFVSGSPFVTLLSEELIAVGTMEPGITEHAGFIVAVDPDVPEGSTITVGINIFSGEYLVQESILLPIGLIFEDFATGDFSSFPWSFSGNNNWIIDSSQSYSGAYSARSGSISHNQSSSMSVTIDSPTAGEISFYLRVSSEANYDFLRFFINNQQQDQWSGTVDWTEVSFPVEAGSNTFRWTYIKDWSVSHGSDCAWVDYIVFPSTGTFTSGPIFSMYPGILEFGEVPVGFHRTRDFLINNFGNEALSGMITTYEGFSIEETTLRRNVDNAVIEHSVLSSADSRTRTGFSGLRAGTEEVRNNSVFDIPAESNMIFTLRFEPENIQDYSGEISVMSNDPNNPLSVIEITASGFFSLVPPLSLEASVEEYSVQLTWEEPEYPNYDRDDIRVTLQGYNLYRNQNIINDQLITETHFEDSVPGNGLYNYYVTAVYDEGESEPSNTVELNILDAEDETISPYETVLKQNYPNPFNPDTTIEFSIETEQKVRIEIFNISGQLVTVLLDDILNAGNHKIHWNSLVKSDRPIASGIYLYRMTAQDYVATRKMILLK